MSTRPPVTECRAVVRKAHHARPGNAGGRRLHYCHVSGAGHDGDTRTSKLEILMAKSKARAATTVAALSLATLAAAPTACGCRRLCD